ncbi:hypothetical protein G6M50_12540 [Agrobacterium rhizogenes]|nr:hypothetical protein [Rhizobium rhizogenes]NTJ78611.1 hypothetical protein [Rhizobium rhizogenes]
MVPVEPTDRETRIDYEALIRDDYARCHPGDTLDFLKHRAKFLVEDKGLLLQWMEVAARKASELQSDIVEEITILVQE